MDPVAWIAGWFSRGIQIEIAHRSGFLWLPVAFGIGILLYFAASEEPQLWAGPTLAVLLLFPTMRAQGAKRAVGIGMLFVALGFSASSYRAARVASPFLERAGIYEVKGYIEELEPMGRRHRLLIRPATIEGVAAANTPFRIRIGAPGRANANPGDFVSFKARLSPPSEAAMPGGYDFRKEAFFRSIGAVGFALGALSAAKPSAAPDFSLSFISTIDSWRNALSARIANTIGGESGALSAALITGKRGLIPEETNEDLRASGLYHIVSISGLHMVLAAGVMFWLVRAILAAIPALVLNWPIKKIAASCAMIGASAYCIFSGSEVATERSLIMTLVMLGAILFDRPALAMRNLAFSALLVLAREPEALMGPSFQMSFSAVACLISANQIWQDWQHRRSGLIHKESGFAGRAALKLGLAFGGIIATTLVATLATAPFSVYHFHRLNPLGLIGNSLAIPLVSLVVMPSAVAGTLLLPFGLDSFIWRLMGEGVGGVLFVAERVAALEHAVVAVPQAAAPAFALLVTALLILVGLRSSLRALCLPVIGLWLLILRAAPMPDLLIEPTGRMALIRGEGGIYRMLVIGTPSSFTLSQWLPALGDNRKPRDPSLREGVACDKSGCMTRLKDGRIVTLSARLDTIREDCQRADIVITSVSAPVSLCGGNARLLERNHFERYGATRVISANNGEWQMETTLNPNAHRPWRKIAPPERLAVTAPILPSENTVPDNSQNEQINPQ